MANNNAMSIFNPGFGLLFDDSAFDRLFNGFLSRKREHKEGEPSKPVYYTNDDGSEIYVELPGCRKEDIEVTATSEGGIAVKAKRDFAGRKDSYSISFTPDRAGFDPDQMKASFTNGILTIPVKEKKKEEPRKLTIE
jgi:HSP20 family molecular chaperone IbpA